VDRHNAVALDEDVFVVYYFSGFGVEYIRALEQYSAGRVMGEFGG
jgi:hypothetical protein